MTESDALPDIIARVRSGVVRIALFNGSDQVGTGSGFLTRGKLVSNSHVIRGEGDFDAVEISFGDEDVSSKEPGRLAREASGAEIPGPTPVAQLVIQDGVNPEGMVRPKNY